MNSMMNLVNLENQKKFISSMIAEKISFFAGRKFVTTVIIGSIFVVSYVAYRCLKYLKENINFQRKQKIENSNLKTDNSQNNDVVSKVNFNNAINGFSSKIGINSSKNDKLCDNEALHPNENQGNFEVETIEVNSEVEAINVAIPVNLESIKESHVYECYGFGELSDLDNDSFVIISLNFLAALTSIRKLVYPEQKAGGLYDHKEYWYQIRPKIEEHVDKFGKLMIEINDEKKLNKKDIIESFIKLYKEFELQYNNDVKPRYEQKYIKYNIKCNDFDQILKICYLFHSLPVVESINEGSEKIYRFYDNSINHQYENEIVLGQKTLIALDGFRTHLQRIVFAEELDQYSIGSETEQQILKNIQIYQAAVNDKKGLNLTLVKVKENSLF
ncbi:MAG: hypothetical protein Q8K60_04940 [Parachlamydiaceae bacterium]|nr:hypothetical protein [Parachlamydiaceae bacterium]